MQLIGNFQNQALGNPEIANKQGETKPDGKAQVRPVVKGVRQKGDPEDLKLMHQSKDCVTRRKKMRT